MSTQVSKLPQDKTPAQRARLKLYEQFGLVFLANAVLAGYVLISSQAAGKTPNWSVVIVTAVAQGLLALFNVLEKYFSANNEPLFSALFDAARQEVANKAPTVTYSANDQTLQQAVNAVLQPVPVTAPQASQPVQNAVVKPQWMQDLSKQNATPVSAPTPQVAPTNAPPANAQLLTTLPTLPSVQA